MNSGSKAFPVIFTLVMLICVLFLVWYLPSVGQRRFLIDDVRKSLETSQGRERKQQSEYDETIAAIPETLAELDRITPLMEAAQQEVQTLKEERKKLRKEKKELEAMSTESLDSIENSQEDAVQ